MKKQFNNKYGYGDTVIEFFKADQAALELALDDATRAYNLRSEGRDFKGTAANIDFKRYAPLLSSLEELFGLISQGYTLKFANIEGMDLDAVLRKPEKAIKAELAALHAKVTDDYEADRFSRNAAETDRQIQITLNRFAREKEKAQQAAQAAIDAELAAAAQAEYQAALGDLLTAYRKQEAA